MQNQRTILWAIFLVSLFFLWDNWQQHQGRPGFFSVPQQTQTAPATGPAAGPTPAAGGDANAVPSASGSTPAAAPGAPTAGAAAAPLASGGERITLDNGLLKLTVNSLGGTIEQAELEGYAPIGEGQTGNLLMLENHPGHEFLAQSGVVGVTGAPNHTAAMTASAVTPRATAEAAAQVTLTAEGGGLRVERTIALPRDSYVANVTTRVTNLGDASVTPSVYVQFMRDSNRPDGTSSFDHTYAGPVVYTEERKFHKVDYASVDKGKADFQKAATDGWLGIIQHYFAAVWLPTDGASRQNYISRVSPTLYTVGAMQTLTPLAPQQSAEVSNRVFIGPQLQSVLEQTAPGLDLVRDYGWLTVVAKPLFHLLNFFHGILGNWGWSIVLLTIVVKLVFFPLQAASYRSMAKMRQVAPKLQAMRERFGDDRVKLNQAMMELYKTEKINPLGGCLPIVVQIPVFIALYWVLSASVEMRGAPWWGWIQDLSRPDPWFVLPVLMAVTMFAQTRLNPQPPDPIQAKVMMWMPLAFSVMFFFFPAGLVLYWFVSNLFSIAQQWVITRHIEGKPVFGRAPG